MPLRLFRSTHLATRRVQVLADVLALAGSFHIAYELRFEFALPRPELWAELHQLPPVVVLQLIALWLVGVQTFIWRYIGMAELRAFVVAAGWPAVAMLAARLLLPPGYREWQVPLSVIVMDTVLAFVTLVGMRVLRRAAYERAQGRVPNEEAISRTRVLLIGAGRAGVAAAREIQNNGRATLEIRGFVDDDVEKLGSVVCGTRVIGTTADLPWLVRDLHIDHVVISIAEASRRQIKRIHDICDSIPVKVRIVPAMHEILRGTVNFSRIRDVQIEDLLGRDPVQLDEADIRLMLAGATVMVTGAGGSIGSELVRQVARFDVGQLLLVERCEYALYRIERELRSIAPHVVNHPLIADIGDTPRMRQIFTSFHPDVVIHAAAHKHVPMMEANAIEAIKNNVLATRLLADMAGQYRVRVFVLISTDKAVRPRSVMGASKRIAELVVHMLASRHAATRYETVRFGNVIGSTGSVIPLFQEQIAHGGPVTVTHPDMTRYFMTIPEAAQLVLEAAAIGEGGEIFILDMGEPVRIVDLAKDVITLTGLKPFEDIDITFTGLRPGEKLFEELETSGEHIAKTRHPKIFIGRIAAPSVAAIDGALDELARRCNGHDEAGVRHLLNRFLDDAHVEAAPAAPVPAVWGTALLPLVAAGHAE